MISRFKLKFRQFLPLIIAFASLLFPVLSTSAANNSINSVTPNFFQNGLIFYDPNECFAGSTTSSQNGAYIGGSEIEEKIWSGLINLNYKPEIVAGIMGNMSSESGFNPARYESSHKDVWESGFEWETDTSEGYGVGLIQWSGERRVKFFQSMRKEANDLTDKYLKKPSTYGGLSGTDFLTKADSESDVNSLISIELQFLNQELKDTSSYSGIFSQSSVEDAAKYFAENVEGCSSCKDEESDTMKKRLDEADRIFKAYNGKSFEGGDTVATTGDYSNILAAKNANESVSGVDSSSEWYAGWSDNDTAALKRVLEHYGDLAYQTGRALNVPWQAILVQMRYENPRAMCGSNSSPNNFWGMGCTGGSKAEARDNLGKGFVTYAEYVTNEYQKHAIGIQDPYEYLVELGPSWVQGCLRTSTGWDNGKGSDAGCTGYSEINSMKKSLEVLENYLQTSEGQAIVQSFGNYKVTSSSSDEECCDPNSLPSTAGTYKGAAWQLSDDDLITLSRIALNENGRTLVSFQSELSLMANRADRFPNYGDVLDYVIQSGWFATGRDYCSSDRTCSYTDEVDSEHLAAAKDIIVNGNRTLPSVVVEHDCFYPECSAGIGSISNDGGNTWISVGSHSEAGNMKDQFKRGETILKQDGGGLSSQYYFWDFADPNDTQTDPFGYYMDESPSESELQPTKGSSATTRSGSDVLWTDDGWISSGIDKYYKDSLEDLPQQETWGADFLTDSLSSQHSGKGPNKILLHVTEGGSSGGNSVHSIYAGQTDANDGKTVPPHFTVDIKNKIIYQHQSIWKASSAIKSDSAGNGDLTAGIQIEIVGYDYGNTGGEWDLTDEEKFTDAEWQYLAEFLNAISVETDIPLESSVDWSDNDSVRMTDLDEFKNYQGILSHKHAPLNDHSDVSEAVWEHIESAISAYANSQQHNTCGGTGATGNFQQTLLAFAWEEYQEKGSDKRTTPKDAYYQAIHKPGAYLADDDDGKDCGVFVTAIVRESGLDPNYNSAGGNTTGQLEYVKNPANGWQDVTDTIKSNQDAKPGDVLLTKEGYTGHTLIYVGNVPGFGSVMASASWHERVPMADSSNDIMFYINGDGLGRKYYVFRKVN